MISSTSQTMYRLDNLNTEQERINYQLSTGKKLQYGSDDSNVYTREVYITDKIKMYDGIKSQIEKISAQNDGSDSALAEAKDLVSYVKAEVIKALNDTIDDSSREVIAENLRGVKENLFDLANEQIEGEYLFSGSDSSVKPFEMDETTGKVYYTGDNELRKTAVEDGSYRDRGINGEEAFFSTSHIASNGETFTFSENDIIYEDNGTEWEIYRLVESGDELIFHSSYDILDGNGETWTLDTSNPVNPVLENNGVTIPVNDIGSSQFSVTVPDTISGLRLNQLRQYDENDEVVFGQRMDISGTYPDNLTTTVRSDIDSLEIKSSIFNVLDNIINALEKVDSNGNTLTSDEAKSELQSGLTNITNAYDAMNVGHAKLGGRNDIFDISYERISAKIYQYERLQQDVSGVDLAEVAVEAKALELTYTSLYSTINRTNELSLVNFLR